MGPLRQDREDALPRGTDYSWIRTTIIKLHDENKNHRASPCSFSLVLPPFSLYLLFFVLAVYSSMY